MAEEAGGYITKVLSFTMVLILNYHTPNPMSIMPITNHPTTPTEMIVSSVTRDSDGLGFGVESESADFIMRGKGFWLLNRLTPKFEQGPCLLIFEVTACIVSQGKGDRSLIELNIRRPRMVARP